MFNIGFGEILIVLVVAFVIVGPDDLPKVARWLGRNVRKLKLLIRDLKRETGWDEIEKEVRDVQRDVKATVKELDVRADLKEAADSVKEEVTGVAKDVERDIQKLDRETKTEIAAIDADLKKAAASAKDAAETNDQ
ncbi:MAG: twin-arginine translocase TatA/TatE family subunit [Clostridia bacterium]|nr:twin-arginine translocase TatA/TatE family subunit [Clostridia bacterium]